MDGSVQTEGDRLRVTVTLIRVRMRRHMVSPLRASTDQPAGAAGGLARISPSRFSSGSRRIASSHSSAGRHRVATRSTHYLKATISSRTAGLPRTLEGDRRGPSRRCGIDPNYALAWTGLASTYAAMDHEQRCRPSQGWTACERGGGGGDPHQSESLRGAEARWHRKVANRLGVDGGRSVLPTGHRSRSERRDGVSIARTRPVAIRSARRRRDSHAPRTRPRPTGAHGVRLVVTGRVPGWRPSCRDRLREACHSHRPDFWIGYAQLGQADQQNGETDLALEASPTRHATHRATARPSRSRATFSRRWETPTRPAMC